MESWMRDLRFAARGLGRSPAFTSTVVVTLALGIAALTIVFSVAYGLFLKPLPFDESARLVVVWQTDGESGSLDPAAYADLVDFRQRSRAFESLAAYRTGFATLQPDNGYPVRLEVAWTTPALPATLGSPPQLGREPHADDARPGARATVLVSDRFWRQRLNGDPRAIGRSVVLDGAPHVVIGVLAPSLDFPTRSTDAWITLQASYEPEQRRPHDLTVVGRLAPGTSRALAQDDMDRVAAELVAAYGNENRGAFVQPLGDHLRGRLTSVSRLFVAAAGLLFLLACINAAALITARHGRASRDAAVCAALGASQGQLARRFAAEALLVAGSALAGSLVLVFVSLPALVGSLPSSLVGDARIVPDVTALAVATTLAVLVAIPCALFPLRRLGRVGPAALLGHTRNDSGRRSGRGHLVLVGGQAGLALLLLVPAGLLASSVWHLLRVDTGFETAQRLRLSYTLPTASYPRPFRDWPHWPEVLDVNRRLAGAAMRLPGVHRAAVSLDQPLAPGVTNSYRVVGRPAASEGTAAAEVPVRFVSPEYFTTVGSALVGGTGFEAGDGPDTEHRMLLNEAAVKVMFPDEAAIGQQIAIWSFTFRVTGVVENERFYGLRADEPPAMFINLNQVPPGPTTLTLLVHAADAPETLVDPLRGVLREIDPAIAFFDVRTMTRTVADSIAIERLASTMFGGFALVALVLALVGISGIVASVASDRRQELGIRMALGAAPGRIRLLLVVTVVPTVVAGAGIGLGSAFAVTRVLESLLFGVNPSGVLWYVVPVLCLGAAACIAALVPAVRASRRDPVDALVAPRN